MKRSRFMLIFGFCIVFFIMSFYLGYQLMDLRIEEEDMVEEQNHKDRDDIEIVREENRISPNTVIENRVYYRECGHLIESTELAENELVNQTRDEYEDYLKTTNPDSRLISFSNVKIVTYSEKNYLCQEHYIIGEHNGNIAIFNIDSDGERLLFKSFTDYPISILLDIDQEKLRDGIIVDSEEELSEVLENFIS
ncbi:MAG TPA: BofC C-terminal domain-containing protein [Tissierellaceae bacterium]|nr:BofC C-terminal domain-containing protein [Tissierellaceae bacterium]